MTTKQLIFALAWVVSVTTFSVFAFANIPGMMIFWFKFLAMVSVAFAPIFYFVFAGDQAAAKEGAQQ